MTLSDPKSKSRVTIDAIDVLRAQLSHDLFAIAKFLFYTSKIGLWSIAQMNSKMAAFRCTALNFGTQTQILTYYVCYCIITSVLCLNVL